jgi:hypothetical protein
MISLQALIRGLSCYLSSLQGTQNTLECHQEFPVMAKIAVADGAAAALYHTLTWLLLKQECERDRV